MTRKEKAKQLIDQFYQTTPNEAWLNEPVGLAKEYSAWQQAKLCAIIHVDEILNTLKHLYDNIIYDPDDEFDDVDMADFYAGVKQEIEKL